MGEEDQVKRIMQAYMQEVGQRGRLWTRWKDVLWRNLEETEMSLEEATMQARDTPQPLENDRADLKQLQR